MAIIEGGDDLSHLWSIITELSEQLNQNRSMSVALYGTAGSVKSQALHSQTGFVLRRFNMDKTQEAYETELERMNAAMLQENQALQHDNKQLNTLIKEYEQTLDTLMTQFRNKAQDVQEHELSIIREYESKLLALEEQNATQELATSTAISESLARISRLLRQCLRAQGGEDTPEEGQVTESLYEREPWLSRDATQAEWAMEREIELARLEKENEELRRMLGMLPAQTQHAPQSTA
ncbi:hypothetical protein Moror_5167 [Moniliophthora roreri MCA 2997]|uniref:Uncharacterized protein n=1 Tax=Moniliophthora roreri (strain MCA 2997) TaxID=1381753 RepID=V2YC16_MONRO|nr:hypothetical protein Moror_5167 [Moniliophthora roreri MCA 2997]